MEFISGKNGRRTYSAGRASASPKRSSTLADRRTRWAARNADGIVHRELKPGKRHGTESGR